MFVLKAEIDSKEVNDWTVQQLVQEKKSQKSRREAEGRDLLLVRHAVPKINSLGRKKQNKKQQQPFYGFIKELEQLMERAQKNIEKNDSQRSTTKKSGVPCAHPLSLVASPRLCPGDYINQVSPPISLTYLL